MYLIIYVCIVCTYVDIEKYLLAMTPMDPYERSKTFFSENSAFLYGYYSRAVTMAHVPHLEKVKYRIFYLQLDKKGGKLTFFLI